MAVDYWTMRHRLKSGSMTKSLVAWVRVRLKSTGSSVKSWHSSNHHRRPDKNSLSLDQLVHSPDRFLTDAICTRANHAPPGGILGYDDTLVVLCGVCAAVARRPVAGWWRRHSEQWSQSGRERSDWWIRPRQEEWLHRPNVTIWSATPLFLTTIHPFISPPPLFSSLVPPCPTDWLLGKWVARFY